MLILPLLAIFLFALVLGLKLLGGHIAWWVVITFAVVLFVPTLVIVVLEVISRLKK